MTHPHLPPGRIPGRQSRQGNLAFKIIGVTFPFVGVFFGLIFIPVGIAIGDFRFILAGIGGTAAFVGSGVAFYRRANPRIAKHFTLTLESTEVRRGAPVRARLEIADAGAVGERLEVGLECEVRYDQWERRRDPDGGYDWTRTTNVERAFELWLPADRTQPVQSCELVVPRDEPYSHEGSCLSFSWKVTAREPTQFRADPVRFQPIWVHP